MNKINTLFLIDDDEIFLFLTQKELEKTALVNRFKPFLNGQQAIEYLKANSKDAGQLPDFILLDLNMPVMDGWQFLKEFKALQPGLAKKSKVYILSSSISPSDIQKAKSFPVVADYLVKPLKRDRFTELVKNQALTG